MAYLGDFDASSVTPLSQAGVIPAGEYQAMIVESTMKETRSGTGEYLELVFSVTAGEYAGRRIWTRLNLRNQNQTAVQIAKAELSAICRAVGVMKPTDSTQLHGIPLIIHVGVKKRDDTGQFTNVIRQYEAMPATRTEQRKEVEKKASSPPWKRKPAEPAAPPADNGDDDDDLPI